MIRVAVIYGGRSTEHSISCISAGAIMAELPSDTFEVYPVGITREGAWVEGQLDPVRGETLPVVGPGREIALSLNPDRRGQFNDVETGEHLATVDVAFPVLHGKYGEDGTIQGFFELSGLPFVGPGVLASACGMDKEYTKKLVKAAGIDVADEVVLRRGEELTDADKDRLGLPVFVKPAEGGSSIGVSKVEDWALLPEALELAFASDDKVIVEAELVGDEVEVGVIEHPDGRVQASVPAKLNGTSEAEEGFYGFEAKYLDEGVTATIPAPYDDATIAEVQNLAVRAFRALGCRGLTRVDFFLTSRGPVLNEVNTMPGFTSISMYPQMFQASGLSYPELVSILVRTAQARSPR
ncbi:D-alanine--D-alanine ligase family protein [Corynebacterium liangguodongii]|uniref:D-alanine--D-alanine ligase n=1 Tax=Corynebacterium liangguodongii TaxID=2079535 RepID=A0A2S0WDS0_9CORY|nr:D-alanine--D-alanine ligase family protein [Corynebacterium liangguodongii]AWB83900.1 D-alanine--D-alanine ligase [Corynebacterium liangguodongii]PWB99039.1 D-alanine--D-alanine ligase [Corynebacterium liangguodongii]